MSQVFLIYASNRTDPTDQMLVRDIAIDSMQANRGRDVSGILMAVGNYFLQVLEGETETVDALLEKIGKDDRHTDIQVLYRGHLEERVFGQWSMGCVRSNGEVLTDNSHLDAIREQISQLCDGETENQGEKLRDMIVQIPKLIADNELAVA
ncbi:MAG: BLUF domain-containing protein [Pseudomonadota bacterium]